MSDIVPFGKYRGQPVEALAADRDYCDWLMAQNWFRDRYQNIYTIVINNQQPAETPEHNALQVLFLDEAYRRAFIETIYPDAWEKARARLQEWRSGQKEEIAETQKIVDGTNDFYYGKRERQEKLTKLQAALDSSLADGETIVLSTRAEFEQSGVDVVITGTFDTPSGIRLRITRHFEGVLRLGIEIKPAVGDDYPAVLRQMAALDRANLECRFLFVEKYTGAGATEDQFRKVFETSGRHVVFRHEVEALL
jgi:hypothetical protein